MAAAIGCWTRNTSLARARSTLSRTARRSTGVILSGTPTTMRGAAQRRRPSAFWTKWLIIRSAASKSAITPSCMGRIALMWSGVLPTMSYASAPTASTRLVTVFMATTDGSRRMIPESCV